MLVFDFRLVWPIDRSMSFVVILRDVVSLCEGWTRLGGGVCCVSVTRLVGGGEGGGSVSEGLVGGGGDVTV